MTDEIRLVIPAADGYRRIAHLVVGGLALRLELTFEDLEDLQVALEALLARRDGAGDVAVSVQVEQRRLRAAVGPFAAGDLDELEREDEGVGLRRVLETVCDSFEVEERDDGAWVELSKRTGEPLGAAG